MLKNKPIIMTAIFLGAIGVLLHIFASVVFICGMNDVYTELAKLIGMSSSNVSTATVCAVAVFFEAAAFFFGYNALSVETE